MSKNLLEDYIVRPLNGLTEQGAKQHAYKKLRAFQDSKGWVFNQETKEFNPVSDEEDLEREIYFELNGKFVAIFASDKKGIFHSVEELMTLAESDEKTFNAVYLKAVEQNPTLSDGSEKEGQTDPN